MKLGKTDDSQKSSLFQSFIRFHLNKKSDAFESYFLKNTPVRLSQSFLHHSHLSHTPVYFGQHDPIQEKPILLYVDIILYFIFLGYIPQICAHRKHGHFETDFGHFHGSNGLYLLKVISISLLWIHNT
jgi:hypothetical protein